MYNSILQKEVQEFINTHLFDDVRLLALKKNLFPTIDYKVLLNQIVAKSKSKDKLPTWFSTEGIIFPEKVSIEQTSSEKTAEFKASIVSGERLIDLTGGFGVDDYYFAKTLKNVVYCEINDDLFKIAKHNAEKLGVQNITHVSGDSFDYLQNSNQHLDWIYIDPSRRNALKGKVFLLADCIPNVPELLDFYFTKSNQILVKVAPLLDITSAVRELKFVKKIHIVSVDNEVKELLFSLEKNYKGTIAIHAVDFGKKQSHFEATLEEETPDLHFGLPKKYLYEPNSSVMKTGSFDLISSRFKLAKLHPNTHLYTSDELIEFQGRIFKVDEKIIYTKEHLKHHFQNQKWNITTRNFTETVENMRKKWKIKDGGTRYSFFTTDLNNQKIVLLCTKIQHL